MFYEISFMKSGQFIGCAHCIFFFFFLSPMINNKYFLVLLVPILPLLLADLFDSIHGKFSST